MDKTSMNLRVSASRDHVLVWIILFFLSSSFLPAVSLAQQPIATMSTVSGIVLVNGQQQGQGTVLNAEDVIETQVGASVVLALSDGSVLEVGEKTHVDIAELRQTATQARVSRIKLMWGWMRAKLSPEHQKEGSSFDIETPNALIGVKFSQPDVEVSYDPAKQETIGLAHTVELIAKNILTNEEMLVPVGSTVIIAGTTIKIIAGIAGVIGTTGTSSTSASSPSTGSYSAGSSGIGTGTILGAGVVAAAGVAAALYIPDLLEHSKSCGTIGVPELANGEVVHAPEGTRCDLFMSWGQWPLEEANIILSEMFYEAIVDNIPLQPRTPLELHQDGLWHIHQYFRTDVLQKGDHSVRAIYRRNQSIFSSTEFTIQVD